MTAPTTPEAPAPAAPEVAPEAPASEQQPNVEELPQWARDAITKANKEAANYRTQVADLKPRADAAAAAQRDAETARADATRYKVAATFGISADHFDLLGNGSEEEIAARAQKISGLLAAQAAAAATIPPATAPASRPLEQLRPGATPSEAQSEDDVIYAKLFGSPATT